jgi:hypothetical protein
VPIALGILLVPFLVFSSVADLPWGAGVGDRSYEPRSVAELASPYRLLAGGLRVDLRNLDPGGTAVSVDVEFGVGRVEVVVPVGVPLNVVTHLGAGEVRLPGRVESGFDVDVAAFLEGDGPPIHLEVDAAAGSVVIRRAPSD